MNVKFRITGEIDIANIKELSEIIDTHLISVAQVSTAELDVSKVTTLDLLTY